MKGNGKCWSTWCGEGGSGHDGAVQGVRMRGGEVAGGG